ncbi:HD-GYP domain-containing protein [Salinimonas marina]|uniref:HD-GYP domain-containing protein n=1 Tax=Salinimonas marina TaxID=2785918 RepID=UPI002FC295CF
MKQHVQFGVEALEAANIAPALVNVVSEHHERLDGKGYPASKTSAQISKEGRMLAIADMYDALTADRCYKPGMPSQKAMKILLSEAPRDSTVIWCRCLLNAWVFILWAVWLSCRTTNWPWWPNKTLRH